MFVALMLKFRNTCSRTPQRFTSRLPAVRHLPTSPRKPCWLQLRTSLLPSAPPRATTWALKLQLILWLKKKSRRLKSPSPVSRLSKDLRVLTHTDRSEERRVGKECRSQESRGAEYEEKQE